VPHAEPALVVTASWGAEGAVRSPCGHHQLNAASAVSPTATKVTMIPPVKRRDAVSALIGRGVSGCATLAISKTANSASTNPLSAENALRSCTQDGRDVVLPPAQKTADANESQHANLDLLPLSCRVLQRISALNWVIHVSPSGMSRTAVQGF